MHGQIDSTGFGGIYCSKPHSSGHVVSIDKPFITYAITTPDIQCSLSNKRIIHQQELKSTNQ